MSWQALAYALRTRHKDLLNKRTPVRHRKRETTMLTEIAPHNLPPFPKRIPDKLKTIREHLGLTPDEIAPMVGAQTGAEILAYEKDEDDLLVTVLWNYSKIAGCPMDQISMTIWKSLLEFAGGLIPIERPIVHANSENWISQLL